MRLEKIGLTAIFLALFFGHFTISYATDLPDIPPYRLGHYLYDDSSATENTSPQLLIGSVLMLNRQDRNRLNLRHSGDLLANDVRFFQPDLVTDGSAISYNAGFSNLPGTKLLYCHRLLRNPRNLNPDFNSIPPLFVGMAQSITSGSIDGITATGGVVKFYPLAESYAKPLSEIHYREGYYNFAPVEFLHSRPIGAKTFFRAEGYIPASSGRFENADHHGNNVAVTLSRKLGQASTLSAHYQNRLEDNGIAFTEDRAKFFDNSLDLNLAFSPLAKAHAEIYGFHTDRIEKNADFRGHYTSAGGGFTATCSPFFLNIRANSYDLDLPDSLNIRLTEVEGGMGAEHSVGLLKFNGMVGVSGWYPDRLGLTGAIGADAALPMDVVLFGNLSRAVDAHSPDIMLGNYTAENRPIDQLDPVLSLRPDLPMLGTILPLTRSNAGAIGLRQKIHLGSERQMNYQPGWKSDLAKFFTSETLPPVEMSIEAAYFNRRLTNPYHWIVQSDTVLTPKTCADRTVQGWRGSVFYQQQPFNGSVSFIAASLTPTLEHGVPVASGEPDFRLSWQIGWNRTFYNETVEADLSFSGKYLNSYYSYGAEGWEELGGAYPMDFKLSFRIKRFTLYWGLHNWNSYQYSLVSGYKMMHKEEYFGIYWLFID